MASLPEKSLSSATFMRNLFMKFVSQRTYCCRTRELLEWVKLPNTVQIIKQKVYYTWIYVLIIWGGIDTKYKYYDKHWSLSEVHLTHTTFRDLIIPRLEVTGCHNIAGLYMHRCRHKCLYFCKRLLRWNRTQDYFSTKPVVKWYPVRSQPLKL
jgi:hypothetical protein